MPTLQRKLHLSEEVAQEKCQKCNHKDVDQCIRAIQEGLLLSAHAPIALQHYIHVIDFLSLYMQCLHITALHCNHGLPIITPYLK